MLDDELVTRGHVVEDRRRDLDEHRIPARRYRNLHAPRAPRRLRHDLDAEERIPVEPTTQRRVDVRANRETAVLPSLLPCTNRKGTHYEHRHEDREDHQPDHRMFA